MSMSLINSIGTPDLFSIRSCMSANFFNVSIHNGVIIDNPYTNEKHMSNVVHIDWYVENQTDILDSYDSCHRSSRYGLLKQLLDTNLFYILLDKDVVSCSYSADKNALLCAANNDMYDVSGFISCFPPCDIVFLRDNGYDSIPTDYYINNFVSTLSVNTTLDMHPMYRFKQSKYNDFLAVKSSDLLSEASWTNGTIFFTNDATVVHNNTISNCEHQPDNGTFYCPEHGITIQDSIGRFSHIEWYRALDYNCTSSYRDHHRNRCRMGSTLTKDHFLGAKTLAYKTQFTLLTSQSLYIARLTLAKHYGYSINMVNLAVTPQARTGLTCIELLEHILFFCTRDMRNVNNRIYESTLLYLIERGEYKYIANSAGIKARSCNHKTIYPFLYTESGCPQLENAKLHYPKHYYDRYFYRIRFIAGIMFRRVATSKKIALHIDGLTGKMADRIISYEDLPKMTGKNLYTSTRLGNNIEDPIMTSIDGSNITLDTSSTVSSSIDDILYGATEKYSQYTKHVTNDKASTTLANTSVKIGSLPLLQTTPQTPQTMLQDLLTMSQTNSSSSDEQTTSSYSDVPMKQDTSSSLAENASSLSRKKRRIEIWKTKGVFKSKPCDMAPFVKELLEEFKFDMMALGALIVFWIFYICKFGACNACTENNHEGVTKVDNQIEDNDQEVIEVDNNIESSDQEVIEVDNNIESSDQEAGMSQPRIGVISLSIIHPRYNTRRGDICNTEATVHSSEDECHSLGAPEACV